MIFSEISFETFGDRGIQPTKMPENLLGEHFSVTFRNKFETNAKIAAKEIKRRKKYKVFEQIPENIIIQIVEKMKEANGKK